MRFSEITEGSMRRKYSEPRTFELSDEEAFSLIKNEYSQSYYSTPLYRGTSRDASKCWLTTPNNLPRLSANTESYVNLFVDSHPKWNKFPKRTKSLICSTSSNYADDFGQVFRVFIKDGVKAGVCKYDDFWDSFQDFSVSSLNFCISNIKKLFPDVNSLEDPNNFIRELKKLSAHIEKLEPDILKNHNYYIINRLKTMYETTFYKALMQSCDPQYNGFKVVSGRFNIQSKNSEVWTEGPAILIAPSKLKFLEKFMEEK